MDFFDSWSAMLRWNRVLRDLYSRSSQYLDLCFGVGFSHFLSSEFKRQASQRCVRRQLAGRSLRVWGKKELTLKCVCTVKTLHLLSKSMLAQLVADVCPSSASFFGFMGVASALVFASAWFVWFVCVIAAALCSVSGGSCVHVRAGRSTRGTDLRAARGGGG